MCNRLEVSRVLVIAPLKVAEDTWICEAQKWEHTSGLKVIPVLGSEAKRIKALYSRGDIWVINRENVPWLVDYYRNKWPFDMVVVDELSSFKSSKAKRFTALKHVRPLIRRIVGLTGTPASNGIMDLWAQVYLLDQGERLHKNVTQFREHYFDGHSINSQFMQYEPKRGALEEIQRKISDLCISLKAEDCLQLPECVVQDVGVHLDEQAQSAYNKLERELLIRVDGAEIDVESAAALSNKLLQLCNGAVYDEERRVHQIHDCKLEAFSEALEALGGEHVMVFYNFQHDRDRLLELLKTSGKRVRVYKTAQDQRDWNAGEIDVLLAHPASTAYGLNLQDGGHHIIWFGLNWSLELYQQANKRLPRQGQRHTVFVHRLIVRGGRDEDVAEALEDKNATQDALMDSLKARIEKVKAGN